MRHSYPLILKELEFRLNIIKDNEQKGFFSQFQSQTFDHSEFAYCIVFNDVFKKSLTDLVLYCSLKHYNLNKLIFNKGPNANCVLEPFYPDLEKTLQHTFCGEKEMLININTDFINQKEEGLDGLKTKLDVERLFFNLIFNPSKCYEYHNYQREALIAFFHKYQNINEFSYYSNGQVNFLHTINEEKMKDNIVNLYFSLQLNNHLNESFSSFLFENNLKFSDLNFIVSLTNSFIPIEKNKLSSFKRSDYTY